MLLILILLLITAAMTSLSSLTSREAFTMFESTIEDEILSAWESKKEKSERHIDDYEKELLSILNEIRSS